MGAIDDPASLSVTVRYSGKVKFDPYLPPDQRPSKRTPLQRDWEKGIREVVKKALDPNYVGFSVKDYGKKWPLKPYTPQVASKKNPDWDYPNTLSWEIHLGGDPRSGCWKNYGGHSWDQVVKSIASRIESRAPIEAGADASVEARGGVLKVYFEYPSDKDEEEALYAAESYLQDVATELGRESDQYEYAFHGNVGGDWSDLEIKNEAIEGWEERG